MKFVFLLSIYSTLLSLRVHVCSGACLSACLSTLLNILVQEKILVPYNLNPFLFTVKSLMPQ